jgi:hypothetical protein
MRRLFDYIVRGYGLRLGAIAAAFTVAIFARACA